MRALHGKCAAAGVGFVDAPVSGGRVKAVSGELSVMVGGTANDVAAIEPLLEPFAGQVFHVGPPGAGTVAKLVNNQLFLAAAVLVQEAYVLGAAAGLEPSELHRIIKASSGGPYAAMAPLLLGRDFDDVIFRLDIADQGPLARRRRRRCQRRGHTGDRGGPGDVPRRHPVGARLQGLPRHLVASGTVERRRAAAAHEGTQADVSDGAVAVDLSDDETFRSGFPHDRFAWLRRHDPVSWHEPTVRTPDAEGFWVVTRHADVSTVLRDPVTFSSDRGGIRDRGGTAIKDERTAGTMLNQTDDPQHQRLRTLVNRGFTPRAVAELEADLQRRGAALLDAAGDEPFDFVHGFARELPSQAICLVLGVPQEDQPALIDWLDAGIEADSPSILSPDAMRKIRTYAVDLIAAKRVAPDAGIMSTIVHARDDTGSSLSDDELIAFFALLFPAGAETTRSALAGAVAAFADHPEELDRLRSEPALVPLAIEEIVRWTTPSVYKRRTASCATELAGVPIGAGDKVTFWEMSANRDELVFAEPFRFDVGRTPNPHLGFGWGPHFCLGASLARLEIRVALDLLIGRGVRVERTGPMSWMPNNRLFGPKHLPVRLVNGGSP